MNNYLNRDFLQSIIENQNTHKPFSIALIGNFRMFLRVMYFAVNEQYFTFRHFHDEIIDHLQKIGNQDIKKNLVINIPPRYGKSSIMWYFVAWVYARNIKSNFIYTSFSSSLVDKASDEIKRIMKHPFYKMLYPFVIFNRTKDNKENWTLEEGSDTGFFAMQQGGTITGFGAGIKGKEFGGALIVDDPLKPADANSETLRQTAIQYFTDTLKSRLNSPKTPIIIIMQRLHIEDLCGYLEKTEPENWVFLKYKALDEEKQISHWEEMSPTKTLMKEKEINPYFFYAQYQQEPILPGGNIIKGEWFKWYDSLTEIKLTEIFITVDTAQKTKEYNDFSVFTVWGVGNGGIYFLDMLRGKWEAPDLIINTKTLWSKWKNGINGCYCRGMYVEDKSSGTYLIQELQSNTHMPIFPMQRVKDKYTRLSDVLHLIAAGKVYLPTSEAHAREVHLLKSECEAFTANNTHKHDDIVDCLIDAILIGISDNDKPFFWNMR